MGNKNAKSNRNIYWTKSQTIRANFDRYVSSASDYDPTKKDIAFDIVTLVLHENKLCSYINDKLEHSIIMNQNQQIAAEDAFLNEIVLGLQINGNSYIWKLRTHSVAQFIQWKFALLVSKRPSLEIARLCYSCKRHFGIFRRYHSCSSCGKSVCNKCSPYLAKLDSLGYLDMQRVCKNCVRNLKKLRESEVGSAIERARMQSISLMRIRVPATNLDQGSTKSVNYMDISPRIVKLSWLTRFSTIE
ncbi:unnamed protein product [Blepharisma stoltei]|uniref:FYVE-type domain-containing protein n=1 Tax=Blepharisma stoltei TaxID=1481888 RepID=A0AAU9K049_9CILI|nr:unnamed protein product [Blepharisma stoltei]